MAARPPTHYQVLGIKPDAKHTEVGLAYNRRMAARRRDDVPPHLQDETRLREAFEVLSDLDRRAEYDARLRAERLKPRLRGSEPLYAVGFLVLVGAGLYWHLRPEEAPAAPGLAYEEMVARAAPAVARLKTFDISGQTRNAGLAFAVDEGTLVTSCATLPANTQLNVEFGQRSLPARVATTDPALGLCKLEAPGAGSWPLAVGDAPPKAGDRVYAALMNAKGEVSLREVKVKNVKTGDNGTVVLTNVDPDHAGTPLLDIHGRVVAVANVGPDGHGRYVPIPKAWGEAPPKLAKPVPYEREAEPAKSIDPAIASQRPGQVIDPAIADLQPKAKMPAYVTPEQEARLQKAFRPPPNVPDDL